MAILNFPNSGLVANVTQYTGDNGITYTWDGVKWIVQSAGIVGTISYTDLTNKPTIPTSFNSLVDGAHQLTLNANGGVPSVTFPTAYGSNLVIEGNEIIGFGSGVASVTALSSLQSYVKLSANVLGPRRDWIFGTDGSLRIPGDITSNGNINIEINLGDSTLRRWQFGEDGSLTLPSVGKINNGAYDWTFGADGSLTLPATGSLSAGSIYFNGSLHTGSQSQYQFEEIVTGEGEEAVYSSKLSLPNIAEIFAGEDISLSTWGTEFAVKVRNPSDYSDHTWSFGNDGSLTLPGALTFPSGGGNIRSEGNINIDINLADSTLRRWQFGEDGDLTLPNGAVIRDTADDAVAFGQGAGNSAQGIVAVAVGSRAGETSQGSGAVAVGSNAGFQNQGEAAVAIGTQTGVTSQGVTAVAIGYSTGYITQGTNAVAIGAQTGQTSQGNNAVAIGGSAGSYKQGEFSVAIGRDAGKGGEYTATYVSGAYPTGTTLVVNSTTGIATGMFISGNGFVSDQTVVTVTNSTTLQISASATSAPSGTLAFSGYQDTQAVAVGFLAGETHQGTQSVAVGVGAGQTTQGIQSVAVGKQAGEITQGAYSVAVGDSAGATTQGSQSVAVGQRAGFSNQGSIAVAIGSYAGSSAQRERAVAVGVSAGQTSQGDSAVAVGEFAGQTSQGNRTVAIGTSAGETDQGTQAVAIGDSAGYINQGDYAVAIGHGAGNGTQGSYAVAIGTFAGQTNQTANSIIINASGAGLDNAAAGFYVKPVRQSDTANAVYYNSTTGEITYSETFSFSVAADDSTQRAISNNESIKFVGAGGITTASDAEGNITITGSGGGTSIPTVVTTGAVGINGAAHAKVQFTVASGTEVTAVGVTVIGVTTANSRITLSGSPGTGSFDIVAVTNTFPGEFYILMPFATNASGTGYGAPISGEGTNPCLVRGTMITMADMSRVAVENITYNDDILVWDFDLGEFASAKPVWIKKTQTAVVSCLLTFSDYSELRIVGDSPKAHRIFNKEAGKFTYGSMPETPIGTTTFNDQGEEITLISKEWIVGEVEFYNVMTDYHMNLFANSILTSMRYNNVYPITDMKFVKDSRTLRTADDYPNVEERLYKGFRLAEQTQSIEEIETHIQWLMSLEVERETESI